MLMKEIRIGRGHLVAVIVANAILWVGAILLAGDPKLGGLAIVGLISISSLSLARAKAS